MLRATVGSVSRIAVETLSLVPTLDAVNSGDASAVTSTVSEMLSSYSVTGTTQATVPVMCFIMRSKKGPKASQRRDDNPGASTLAKNCT